MRTLLHLLATCVFALSAHAQVAVQLDLEPATAEIGQPVTLILTAEHEPSFAIELPKKVLPDDSWVLYQDAKKVTLPHPKRDGMSLTVVRWQIASLEPGERAFEFPKVSWGDGSEKGLSEVTAPTLSVGAALAAGEDEPRAALMFREPVLPEPRIGKWPWVLGGLVFLVGIAILLRRKRRSEPQVERVLSPLESLEALEARSGELGIRATYFELSRLVRSALDAGEASRAGLTDEEWLALWKADPNSSPQEREVLAALFERCREVKYAQVEPTRWALDESLASAKALAQSSRREEPEVAA